MEKSVLVFLLLLIFVLPAPAAELHEYNIPLRARGMGGVYSPFPDTTDMIFVNPAALVYVDEIAWDMVNVGVGVNDTENYEAYSELGDCSGGVTCYDSLYGKKVSMYLNGRTSVVFPYFSLAGYQDFRLSGILNSPPFPDFDLSVLSDNGMMLGFGVPLGPTLSAGMNIKRIQRVGGSNGVGLSTIASGTTDGLIDSFKDSGSAWGVDTALMLKTPGFVSSSLVLMWKDVGGTTFTHSGGSDNPPMLKDNLIFGAGLEMDLTGLDVRAGAEYRHINEGSVQLGKKLHLGGEISLPLIDVRAGVSQGYQSFGAGVNLWFLKLDAAYYHVELGDYPGQTPDLRMEASLSLQLAVDADFKFTTKDGKRRKLKQRR